MTINRFTGLNKVSCGYVYACTSNEVVIIIWTAPIKAVAVSSDKHPQIKSSGNIKLDSLTPESTFLN